MAPAPVTQNTLYYGDNLTILREYIPDESIDLIYLDPPFNSRRTYNVLFKDESGTESDAQIAAFGDTWHWNQHTEATYYGLATGAPDRVARMIVALREFIGPNQMMAYLVMMCVRLVELHRVLKTTGSLYLHCDPTASHYLKVMLDAVFGNKNFVNEIVWYYRGAGIPPTAYARRHDILLFYAKNEGTHYFNPDPIRQPYAEATKERFSHHIGNVRDGHDYGVQTLHPLGKHPDDVITHIQPIAPSARARLGYPTQKPEALLETCIQASSKEGDLVLDPFCGCGTTIAVAERLKRRWIGIDITHLAITLIKNRLRGVAYKVVGEPVSILDARVLAAQDPYQFQWWALGLVQARPYGGEAGSKRGKKGSDRGIDGVIIFPDSGKMQRVLVQVKGGHIGSPIIRDLRGTIEREKAAIGVLVTMEPATSAMETEAATAGYYHSPGWRCDYPKMQILTVEQLLAGAKVQMPSEYGTFKQADRVQEDGPAQGQFDL